MKSSAKYLIYIEKVFQALGECSLLYLEYVLEAVALNGPFPFTKVHYIISKERKSTDSSSCLHYYYCYYHYHYLCCLARWNQNSQNASALAEKDEINHHTCAIPIACSFSLCFLAQLLSYHFLLFFNVIFTLRCRVYDTIIHLVVVSWPKYSAYLFI